MMICVFLLFSAQICKAGNFTLTEANTIIMILVFVIILLLVLGGVILYYNRKISQRNEKLRRILNGLEAYRKMMNHTLLPAHDASELPPAPHEATKPEAVSHMDEGQKFFVEMDARVTREKPFVNPDFDHQALIDFLGVTQEILLKQMPRYSDPKNTISYINSRRAEYGAQLIMDHADYAMDEVAVMCGFRDSGSFNAAFKFAYGITPNDYMNSMKDLFKR
ncbi:MAG: helix-turn-helix domain-containing protein [Prevotella sp.]|nr:helix-turn-helix domain-containing protein [Prevotella sp.]